LERRGGIGDVAAMSATAPNLPDDVVALRALVLEQHAELALARSGLVEQRYEIEVLKVRLAKLLRAAFGQSSENFGLTSNSSSCCLPSSKNKPRNGHHDRAEH
jgi:hypothetical protein